MVSSIETFEDQVRLFSEHGVVIAPHGAGLMNLMFARPFGSVIEIFPYRTHHNLYPGIARMMGLAHYPVHTYNGTSILSTEAVSSCRVVLLKT